MKKLLYIAFFSISTFFFIACGPYSFTGVTTDAESIQIDFFPNQAPIVEPSLTQRFTNDLQDLFTRQTNLTLVRTNGELQLSGEIIGYRITPLSGTSNQTAAQNRLTVTVNVRYINTKNDKDDFEKSFSFYSDFEANEQLTGSVLENALDEIIERITQDIFNASLSNWG
ncbi:LPS assembly lipoprotein LptE [Polaribacter sp. MSW13]|uniref:LPS assembly lipoprotein LptE n=1 Tax=Polaribacter marinus TaxID=2916838 RepID=A0A9X1VMC2_9FLAO|nr:LptE family protein [Polaribacter marinus]MCI2229159.1 LPS assembly lipoprotein LptE [Polaribacter marinus]